MNIQNNYQHIKKDDLSIGYMGSFDDSIIEVIIELSEAFLDKSSSRDLKRKAVFLSAECIQNVTRHGLSNDSTQKHDNLHNAFFLRVQADTLYIASVNAVENKNVTSLSNKITEVNELEKDELYRMYKQVLEDGKLSVKGGASLGLIEMARKTANKIDFHFEKHDDQISNFYMMIGLKSKKMEFIQNEKKEAFIEIRNIYEELVKTHTYILFKSDFSHDTILPVLLMIQRNMDENRDRYSIQRNLFHSSVEILQHIANYGYKDGNKINGIFALGRKGDVYFIKSMNEIKTEEGQKLSKRLDGLIGKTEGELKSKFRKKIISGGPSTPDLAFIDLARISKSWSYSIFKVDSEISLFSYEIKL